MTSVLITGASGFVGQFLGQYLATGKDAFCSTLIRTYRSLPQSLPQGSYFTVGKIDRHTRWQDSLVDVDVVVHLAARVHVMHETHPDPLGAFREVNTLGTLNLARQAVEAGVKRFIYLSTIKVNGEKTEGQPFYADDSPHPQDPYAVSKFEAEQQLLALGIETGLEVVIIRPPLVYGRGVKGNFNRLFTLITNRVPLPLKGICNKRSFVSLGNLSSLIEICLTHPAAANNIFLVSDGRDLSTPELFEHLAYVLKKKSFLFYLPQKIVRSFAFILGRKIEYNRLVDSLQVDISKNKLLLGWQPVISVKKGFAEVVSDA